MMRTTAVPSYHGAMKPYPSDRLRAADWLAGAVVYNVFPASFRDSNGDGIGDLPGITEKLDYISALGANVVWLNPIFDSPFGDAGYDVRDYRAIAPRYGTIDDFDRLVARAHELDIRVLLDFVPGHTSTEHPWFVASASADRTPYDNWYVWTEATFAPLPENAGGASFINGYSDRDGRYLANFFWFQPALNYGYAHPRAPWQLPVDHPDVIALKHEMRSIMRFWLDRGVDGFRVDMASSLIKGSDRGDAMKAYWRDVRAWFDAEYPHAALVSEWSYPREAIDAGFHVDFLIHIGQTAYNELFRMESGSNVFPSNGTSIFRASGGGHPDRFWDEYEKHYHATKRTGYISIPSGNHDFPRISFGRSTAELKSAFLFLLTMPGVPTIYYGDEIGMRHADGLPSKEGAFNRTAARTPMQWDQSDNLGFSSTESAGLYLPVDGGPDAPVVSEQANDPASLLSWVKRLIVLRREHPALGALGHFERARPVAGEYPLCYLRWSAAERLLVCVNPTGGQVEAELVVPWRAGAAESLIGDPDVACEDVAGGVRVVVPAVAGAVFRMGSG